MIERFHVHLLDVWICLQVFSGRKGRRRIEAHAPTLSQVMLDKVSPALARQLVRRRIKHGIEFGLDNTSSCKPPEGSHQFLDREQACSPGTTPRADRSI